MKMTQHSQRVLTISYGLAALGKRELSHEYLCQKYANAQTNDTSMILIADTLMVEWQINIFILELCRIHIQGSKF